jgi:hypothetical protein
LRLPADVACCDDRFAFRTTALIGLAPKTTRAGSSRQRCGTKNRAGPHGGCLAKSAAGSPYCSIPVHFSDTLRPSGLTICRILKS